MKEVEKYENFEELKKSEISQSRTTENNQETVEKFIQLLKKNANVMLILK